MSNVRNALALSLAERYVLVAISLLGNILLARLLTPKEIGIYSVSLAVIGIAHVLRDFGIGSFLIQEKSLTEAHVRTAFGFSLVIGSSLALLVFLAAPFIGAFYSDTRMVPTLRISALNFVVLPFCTISLALLRRDMLFSRMVPVTLVAAASGFGVTISLAYLGVGANSMAIGAVAGNVVTGLGAWLARVDRRLLLPSLSEWRALLSFGGQSSITGIVTSISIDANDLIVGKVLGFQPVAILSRAQGLMNLFHRDIMSAVTNVALPAFAAAARSGANLDRQHTKSVAIITVLAWPFYGGMSIYAFEALRLLAGQQWDEARFLVPIFCLAGAVAALSNLALTLLTGAGRIDLVTRVELLVQPLRIVFIAVAAIWFRSTEACALAYLAITALAVPVFYHAKNLGVPTDHAALFKDLFSSLLVTVVTLSPPIVHATWAGWARVEPAPLPMVGVSVFLAVILWIVATQAFGHPIAREAWFLRYLSLARLWRRLTLKREAVE